MEERSSPATTSQTTGEELWSERFAESLSERRQQALDLVATQHQQFEQIEAELNAQLTQLEQRLTEGIAEVDSQTRTDLDQFANRLRQQAEEIARGQTQLATDRAEIASRQAELQLAREQLAAQHQELAVTQREEIAQLERRATDIHALEVKVKQAERTFLTAQDEHQSEVRQLTSRRARFEEQQLRLERETDSLEALRDETRTQRRRIAQQLKIERAALAHERELTRADSERHRNMLQTDVDRGQAQLREDREAFQEEANRLRQQLRRDRAQLDEDVASLEKTRRQWEESRRQVERNREDESADLSAAQRDIERLSAQLSQSQQEVSEATALLAEMQQAHQSDQLASTEQAVQNASELEREYHLLQAERDTLSARVEELEEKLTAAEHASPAESPVADAQRMEDLQRRFEMAVDDVRQFKRRNSELEEELAAQKAVQPRPDSSASSSVQDWETTKRRMIAQLEGEAHDNIGGMSADERLSVEGAIRITDGMVTERDREIAELKQQLAQLETTTSRADAIAAEAATAEILDRDEIIQQERHRLTEMQDEWQEKLRQAEVDISVHRARIARERAELDEKRRALEAAKADEVFQKDMDDSQSPGGKSSKPTRRWLSRLGLKENDER